MPITRTERITENGKEYEVTLTETSRTEVSAARIAEETLVAEGVDPDVAAQTAAILAANELI